MGHKTKIMRLLSLAFVLFITQMAIAQTQITGSVKDTSGEPLIGVSVVQKGAKGGSITDLDGNFSIKAEEGATLVFSYVGFQTVEMKARPKMTVTMAEENKSLNEVVVVGYGVQKKSVVTGAISQVKSEDILNSSNTRPEQALQGKTSGVQVISSSGAPGSTMKIRIRGYSSNGNADPLYIVDGLRTTDISSLEANDIETMEVLKDGASAAIYGAEGGNGVVLITTKKGKAGNIKINYNFQYTIQSIAKVPKVMHAQDYLTYMKEGGAISKSTEWDGTDTDWLDEITENAPQMKHNLSISGGNEKFTYMASLSYLDHEGIIKGDQDNYKRYSGMFNGSIQAKKWLKFTSDIKMNHSKTTSFNMNDGSRGVISNALMLDPLTPVYYESDDNLPTHVQTLLNAGNDLMRNSDGKIYGISQYVTGECINPLVQRTLRQPETTFDGLTTNIEATLTPFKGFSFTSRFGVQYHDFNLHVYSPKFFYSSEMKNDNASVSELETKNMYYQWENFANYSFLINKEHNFSLMLGMSISSNTNKTISASGYPLLEDKASYAYLSYVASQAGSNVGGTKLIDRKASWFGRLNYDYKNRYMFEATLRRDGAGLSILPKDKRWGTFPAFSAGWTITEEDWFPKQKVLDFMKLRVSWGQNGSLSNLGSYSYASNIAKSGSNVSYLTWSSINASYLYPLADGTFANAAYPSSLGNYNLTWETSDQFDVGMDFRFFKQRLGLTVDYFVKKTKDLITTNTPSYEAGNTASPINGGDVKNNGLDLELSWRDNIGDFSYGVSGNISFLKNKVTYLDPSLSRINGVGLMQWTGATAFEKGHPVWYMRGYKTDGVDPETGNLKVVDVNNDGTINTNDYTEIGSAIPDFTYGLTLNAAYKGFDFVVFIQGEQGNDILYGARRPDRTTVNKLQKFYDGRWTETNANAKYPSAYWQLNNTNFWNSDMMVFNGSYMKIKQIQLGYNLPKTLLSKAGISSCRVYVSLDNFFTFTSYPGMDPEASSTDNNGIGVDQGFFPIPKDVMFGLSLSF